MARLAVLLASFALLAPVAHAAVPAAKVEKVRGPGAPLLAALDLPPAELKARYGSKARYLLHTAASVADATARGFILPHDALAILAAAARTKVS